MKHAPQLPPFLRGVAFPRFLCGQRRDPAGTARFVRRVEEVHAVNLAQYPFHLRAGLQRVHHAIQAAAIQQHRPSRFQLNEVVENLKSFNGKVIIQTLFLRGNFKGETIDNTTEAELSEWLKRIAEVKPSQVMIYTIDRDTPATGLEKIKLDELELIASRAREIGFDVQVSG